MEKMNTENRRWTEKYRHILQAFWFALSNGYARGFTTGMIYTGPTKAICVPGLNCYSCPGAIGACPIGSLQAIIGSNSYRLCLYVTGALSMFGVLLGRLVCGFLCPFGLVQDLIYKIPFPVKKKNLPGHRYLKYLRYVIFLVFVILLTSLVHDVTGTGIPWFCEWICPSGTLLAGVPLLTLNPEFREAIGFQFFWKMGVMIIILLGSIVYYRPFCKYICPLGAVYGVFNPVSTYRLTVDESKCVNCGMCQKACGMDIRTNETPNSPDCIRCLKCVSACPTKAIDSSWNIARKKYESRLAVQEEIVENKEQFKTMVLGIISIIAGLSVILTIFIWRLPEAFTYRFDDLIPAHGLAIYASFSVIKGLMGFFFVIIGISLLRKRSDANEVHRFRERMKLIYRIWVISIFIYIAGLITALSLVSMSLSDILLCPFPLFGTPLLYLAGSVLDKKVNEEENSTDIFWWFIIALLVLITGYSLMTAILTVYEMIIA